MLLQTPIVSWCISLTSVVIARRGIVHAEAVLSYLSCGVMVVFLARCCVHL